MTKDLEIFRKKIDYKDDGDFKLWSEVIVTECMKEIAIGFAEWIDKGEWNCYVIQSDIENPKWESPFGNGKDFTTEELYIIFLSSKK